MVGSTVSLGASVVAIISTPFTGGVSGALGLMSMHKDLNTIFDTISSQLRSFDGHRADMVGAMEVCEAAHRNHLSTANEVTAMLFSQFLGAALPSLKTASKSYTGMKACHGRVVGELSAASIKLNKILDGQEALQKEVTKQVSDGLKNYPSSVRKDVEKKVRKELEVQLAPSRKAVIKALDQIGELDKKTKQWKRVIDGFQPRLQALKKKDPAMLKALREMFKLASFGLSGIDGNGLADSVDTVKTGIGMAVSGYAYDRMMSKAIDGTVLDAA